eukprot:TRINITY_DN5032_c0_g2_i2.p1 TRINITY_DN5032_c0_g2~~TRINITY_DN5032_c0_g2_i2.p1  ORF type:complete len:378 (+),score=106.04 TRINITY_DN5032_c0_g2_i2:80-1213(+)
MAPNIDVASVLKFVLVYALGTGVGTVLQAFNASDRDVLQETINAIETNPPTHTPIAYPEPSVPPRTRDGPVLIEDLKNHLRRVAGQHAGVYYNKALHPGLNRTVLVTMANWGFRQFYFNWVCLAESLGLDHMLLSVDRQLHGVVGASRSVLLDDVKEKQEWGTESYYDMGCKKIDAVRLLVEMGYNVLFSDADNVIGSHPIQLLREITESHYDVLIQADHFDCVSRSDCPFKWKSGKTANGGFYYWSGKRQGTLDVLRRVVQHCRMKPRTDKCCDDQQAVNKAIHELVTKEHKKDAFKGADFCSNENDGDNEDPKHLQYCVMDPAMHPAGKHPINYDKLVSYHANWILKGSEKVKRLRKHGLWQWNDTHCVVDDESE